MIGVVLAGGEGRRMGCDKALLEFEGQALWRRQAGVLRDAGATRVFVSRRRDQEPIDWPDIVYDQVADCGPLAGMSAALALADSEVAVLAVDMPGIDADWFARLRSSSAPGVGAVGRLGATLEPLAAIYPSGSAAVAASRLARRALSAAGFALELAESGKMTVVAIDAEAAARMASLNEPRA